MLGKRFDKPLQNDVIFVEKTDEKGNLFLEEKENDAENTVSKYAEAATWCNENNATIEDKGEYYEVVALPEQTEEEKIALLKSQYVSAIQGFMDKTVQERDYDSVFTCISYLGDPNETYAKEAAAVFAWRSAVWDKGHEILNKVLAGEMELPTVEDVIALLPRLEW